MAPVKGVAYGDGDFIQGRSGKLLGYDAQSNRLVAGGDSASQNLEEYLLTFRANSWQKFLAEYFGLRICLGYFKKVGDRGFMNWYLFWCERCEQFQVSYKHGFDGCLDCKLCQNRALKF